MPLFNAPVPATHPTRGRPKGYRLERPRRDAGNFRLARMLWRLGHSVNEVAHMIGRNASAVSRGWRVQGYELLGRDEQLSKRLRLPRDPLTFADYVAIVTMQRGKRYRALVRAVFAFEEGDSIKQEVTQKELVAQLSRITFAAPPRPPSVQVTSPERIYPKRPRGRPPGHFRLGAHDDYFTVI